MISLDQALAHYAAIAPLQGQLSLPLAQAHGHVLAKALRSRLDLPPMNQSAMDGYALRRSDLNAAKPEHAIHLPVTQSVAAGQMPQPLAPGSAARIFTGAAIPEGADCIEIQENASREDGRVRLHQQPVAGANIRLRGEELRRGQVVLPAGQRLDAQSLSIAASAGHARLACRAPARVAVIVTGSELVAPGTARSGAQIFESNGSFLRHFVTEQGARLSHLSQQPDDPAALTAAVEQALRDCDMLLISGGASVGEHDHSRQVLADCGVQEVFWKVAQKPGKPLSFGHGPQGQLVFALPGNPASVYVSAMVHVRAALKRLSGQPPFRLIEGRLERSVTADRSRERLLRVALVVQQARLMLRPLPRQASHMNSNLAHTQAIARIPAGQNLQAGSLVKFWPLTALL